MEIRQNCFFLSSSCSCCHCLSFIILEVFLNTTWIQKPPASCTNREKHWFVLHLLIDLDRHSSLTLSYFVSLSHIKSCFSLAAFSSALVSVNRGPHNSSMHHWPRWIILCLTDSSTHLTTILLCHTHRLSLHDGLHNGLWWIIQQAFTYKHTNILWLPAISTNTYSQFCGWVQGEIYSELIQSDARLHYFICLTRVVFFSLWALVKVEKKESVVDVTVCFISVWL